MGCKVHGGPVRAGKRKKNIRSSPRDWSKVRIIMLGAVLVLAWSGLWARGFYLQVLRGPALALQAKSQHWTHASVYGKRGEIFDRNGELLAKSIKVKSAFARPNNIQDPENTAAKLVDILGGTKVKWLTRLQSDSSFVWLTRQISDQVAARLEASGLQGVYLTEEQRRFYPQGQLAGQVLGFVGVDNQGLEGLELSFDSHLSGDKRTYVVQRDAAGHVLFAPGQFQGDGSGHDLHLTLDADVQYAAETALEQAVSEYKAKSGTCVVVDVQSGEILAWAQDPLFNPNMYRVSNPSSWRNLLATESYEPGSTIKPFLVAAALDHNVVDNKSIYFCENGRWTYKGRTVKDTHEYAWLPVSRIIRYSSNIGAGKIGLELGAQRYYSTLQSLGFGTKTGLPLPAENKGTLRPPQRWNEVDLVSASFGQGLAVTGLQLAQAYLTLCTKGEWLPLRLVKTPQQEGPPERRIFSSSTARDVLGMLHDVVEEDGTGTQARIEGLRVGGKTGTAQKASAPGGYGNEYVASFVGLFPALQPRYLVLAIVDEPKKHHYGGVVAAPVVREVGSELMAWSGLNNLTGQPIQAKRDTKKNISQNRVRSQDSSVNTSWKQGDPVPDLCGLPVRQALEILAGRGIMPSLKGQGVMVSKQRPVAQSHVSQVQDKEWILWLSNPPGQEEST